MSKYLRALLKGSSDCSFKNHVAAKNVGKGKRPMPAWVEPLEQRLMLSGDGVGLRATYYNTSNNAVAAPGTFYTETAFNTGVLSRADAAVNFNWGAGVPATQITSATNFSARWSGNVQALYSENYTFSVVANGGVRVWIKDVKVIDTWGTAGSGDTGSDVTTTSTIPVAMTAGQLSSVLVEYYNSNGNSDIALKWQSTSQPLQVIPQTQLYMGDMGLRQDIFNNSITPNPNNSPISYTRTDPIINYSGATSLPLNRLTANNWSSRWTGQIIPTVTGAYTFNAKGNQVRLYVNDLTTPLINWTSNGTNATAINLVAGTKYSIEMDYYQNTLNAPSTQLYWSAPGLTKQIVPAASLYPYSKPITITAGGTYAGNWEDTSIAAYASAVTISTASPVTITNSNIRSRATGILDWGTGGVGSLIVTNTSGYFLNPNDTTKCPGTFISTSGLNYARIENNYMENTWGMRVGITTGGTALIRYNKALNINGSWSNGNGGYQTARSGSHFLQFAGNMDMVNTEVAWNQVIDQAGLANSDDTINMYESRGTPASPIRIHDNYVQGPSDSAVDAGDGWAGDTAANVTCYVQVYNNQAVGTSFAIADGHDIAMFDNRQVSSVDHNGSGFVVYDCYGNTAKGLIYNNSAYNNYVGWKDIAAGGRADYWMPSVDYAWGNTGPANTGAPDYGVPATMEAQEYALWQTKLAAAKLSIGPTLYLSDIPNNPYYSGVYTTPTGTFSLDSSIGGHIMQIGGMQTTAPIYGTQYTKGIGALPATGAGGTAEIDINLAAASISGVYNTFLADIGLDQEALAAGSVQFIVKNQNNTILYQSPTTLTGSSHAYSIAVSLAGVTTLKLIVTNYNKSNTADNADWANARFVNLPPTAAPAAPTTLQSAISTTADSQVTLTWVDPNNGNESYFLVDRSPTADFATYMERVVPAGTTTWQDSTLAGNDNSTYYYRVRAVNAAGMSAVSNSATAVSPIYVSDLTWSYQHNGWGNIKRDQSKGYYINDYSGMTLSINGVKYRKGLGMALDGTLNYPEADIALNGAYGTFVTDVGVDDESSAGDTGSTFLVYGDSTLLYQSSVMTYGMPAQHINVNVASYTTLRLVVKGSWSTDPAWGGARLVPIIAPVLPLAPTALNVTNVTTTSATINWTNDPASSQTAVIVQRSSRPDFFNQAGKLPVTIVGTVPGNATSFTDNTLTPGTTYYYRVQAVNDIGYSPFNVFWPYTTSVVAAHTETLLSALTIAGYTGAAPVVNNNFTGTGGLIIGTTTYANGLGVQATTAAASVVTYYTNANYSSLTGTVGLDATANPAASVTFTIYNNNTGALLWTSGALTGGATASFDSTSFSLLGVGSIRLMVISNNSNTPANADWGLLTLGGLGNTAL